MESPAAPVEVALGERSYPIHIGEGLLEAAGAVLRPHLRGRRALIVQDEAVAAPWGRILYREVAEDVAHLAVCAVPQGEPTKSPHHLKRVWDALAAERIGRDGVLLALGGGVVGDLAGFAAATWHRGIDYLQIPTTLLAMVDSSVGGKTGINHESGKNLVGAFWQPRAVLIDPRALRTLPAREVRSGLAEVVKYGVIADAEFFRWLESSGPALLSGEDGALARAIRRSCELKAEVVAGDEREAGRREILNFGHTIGHAVEALGQYGRFRHGEAVAIGMAAEGRMALKLGLGWTPSDQDRLELLLTALGLPATLGAAGWRADDIIQAARADKKARAGSIRYSLPEAMGRCGFGHAVPDDTAAAVLREIGAA
ncbi:MAG: 3-dehydroquinate synthase [Candidatus Sumerlaeia bacterium]|nr:3-dehydroquinate synthase [Candidatus Sumerlaeia bacterium]